MLVETAIILVNYNTPKRLLENCFISLNNIVEKEKVKILLIDNNSKNKSEIEFLRKKYSFIEFIFNKENFGFGGANNIGINYAIKKYSPKYFYFLNTDTMVKKDFLSEAIKCINNKKVAIVGSNQKDFLDKFRPASANIFFTKVNYNVDYNKNKFVDWVSGAGFLIKTKILKEINFFDEIYNPAYYEETDLEKKCLKKGYKILFCFRSLIWHKGSGSTNSRSDYIYFIFHRNRIIYFLRYYSLWFFSLRFFYDIYKAFKQKRLKLLFKAYFEGFKLYYHNRKN